jgi:hypothetical protein
LWQRLPPQRTAGCGARGKIRAADRGAYVFRLMEKTDVEMLHATTNFLLACALAKKMKKAKHRHK